jgi:hypothetical protein
MDWVDSLLLKKDKLRNKGGYPSIGNYVHQVIVVLHSDVDEEDLSPQPSGQTDRVDSLGLLIGQMDHPRDSVVGQIDLHFHYPFGLLSLLSLHQHILPNNLSLHQHLLPNDD